MADINATKSALAKSMKELMAKKDFSKISITDICDGCGMSRKSFYYHFKDKYDLMNWIFYMDFMSVVSSGEIEDGWQLIEAVCELFYESQPFYRSALRTDGQNSFKEYLLESMLPLIEFMFEDLWGESDSFEVIGKMFCNLYIITVTNWMEEGCKLTPAELIISIKEIIKKLAASL